MATGQDIIKEAFQELGISESEEPIEAADMQLGLKKLNDMLTEWDEAGRIIGFTPLGELTDDVRLTRGLHGVAATLLAGRLAAPMKMPISAELAASIKLAGKMLLRITVKLGEVKLPSTLPRGTGNDNDRYNGRFFDEQDKENF